MNRRLVDLLVIVVIMGIPLAVLGGGIFYLTEQLTGTPGAATVKECHLTGTRAPSRGVACTGTWIGDEGVVGSGIVNGAVSGDEGTRVNVKIRDGAAYTTSLATPIVLIVLGGGVAGLFGWLIGRGRRTNRPSVP